MAVLNTPALGGEAIESFHAGEQDGNAIKPTTQTTWHKAVEKLNSLDATNFNQINISRGSTL